MHTPVSNAAQGAYVVAACVTGLIAGGASLLFKDVTEGISCFLGGFCFSMWILVLKPGGTIHNTTGKILFISCLTVCVPALYISRHTRPYGLIGSTSFAGATAVVLGIDCFSRAGLKEFWLYIWNINNEIFPLNYNGPYPITRGIQVETGAIIIVCAMGIMSQMKVWKIISRRKEEREREQRRKDEEDNLADEEQGRRVEDGIKRERGSWEAAYGSSEKGRPHPVDSGIGTDESGSRKGSLSNVGAPDVRGSDSEGIELQEMDASPNAPEKGEGVLIHVIQDDKIPPTPSAAGQHLARSIRESREPSVYESQIGASPPFGSEPSLGNAAVLRSVDQCPTPKPEITHLPFKVPVPISGSEDGRSSVAASAASEHVTNRRSKSLSGSSTVRMPSNRSQRSSIAASTSKEASMIPDTEYDRASSVAATIDGVSEKDDLEEESLSVRDQRFSFEALAKQDSMQGTHQSAGIGKEAKTSPRESANQLTLGGSQAEEAQRVDGSIEPRPESVALPDSEIASITDARSIVQEPNFESRKNIAAESEAFEQHPRIYTLLRCKSLPEGASRVVTAYRTNEWAKHLEGAELPEIHQLKLKEIRAPEPSLSGEPAAPVDARALQQTPLNAEPPPILSVKRHSLGERPASYFETKNPFHKQGQKHTQPLEPAVHQPSHERAMDRTPSQISLANNMERSASQTSLGGTQSRQEQYRPPIPKFRSSQSPSPSSRGFRRSLTPVMASPLVQSPIEEGVESSFPTRFTPSPTHLMSHRDSMLRSKTSSTTLLRNWSNATLEKHPALRVLNEDENITLAQRKSLLQHNPHSVLQLHRSSSGPILGTSPQFYPSHNGAPAPTHSSRNRPSRTPLRPLSGAPSLTPRDPTVSAWHASLQAPPTAHFRDQEIEARRADLLAEKRRESSSRQEQRLGQNMSQSAMDRGMRQRSMIELHQQRMRKMQAEANRSLA